MNERPKKITARVAPFLDAIDAARKAGWSWAEIRDRVAPETTVNAIRMAALHCKYSAEQLPLPELRGAPAESPTTQPQTQNKQQGLIGKGGNTVEKASASSVPSGERFDFESINILNNRR